MRASQMSMQGRKDEYYYWYIYVCVCVCVLRVCEGNDSMKAAKRDYEKGQDRTRQDRCNEDPENGLAFVYIDKMSRRKEGGLFYGILFKDPIFEKEEEEEEE